MRFLGGFQDIHPRRCEGTGHATGVDGTRRAPLRLQGPVRGGPGLVDQHNKRREDILRVAVLHPLINSLKTIMITCIRIHQIQFQTPFRVVLSHVRVGLSCVRTVVRTYVRTFELLTAAPHSVTNFNCHVPWFVVLSHVRTAVRTYVRTFELRTAVLSHRKVNFNCHVFRGSWFCHVFVR